MDPDDNQPQDLRQSIESYERLVRARRAREQRNLIRGIRQLHPDAQDKGVNEAKFVVLRGATMPSVLTEISFLTNEHEAALLSTDVYLDQISDALLDSILDYQQTLPLPVRASADGND